MATTVNRGNIIEVLRASRPEWHPDAEDPIYAQLGSFGRHLLRLFQEGQTRQLAPAFAAIERLHVEGDDWAREAATIGILEAVQNIASHSGYDLSQWVECLGPESRRWWNKLNDFWSGRTPTVG
jgi:hypothetical protein